MKRQLKFRAWHNGAKEMLFESRMGDVFKWYQEHQDIIIMQSTGLKDKNGKEIYEKDLFYIEEMQAGKKVKVRGKVIYNEDRFEIEWIDRTIMNNSIRVRNKEMVLIGDEFSNPELIKPE